MPFVVRKIEPRYIGRGHVPQDNSCVEIWPVGAELEAIINGALACTLKQLASLLTNAQDIFQGLNDELGDVANRSGILRQRIHQLDNRLSSIDPKKIPVPESDISSFASRTEHFKSVQKPTTGLFAESTRPRALKKLYQQASVIAVRNLDYLRVNENDTTAVEMFLCTPILGKRRRDQSLDIESRFPAIFDDLRRWTSSEALGDITVAPDCMSRIVQSSDADFSSDDAVDHKLPSPEEQVQVIALKFPAEIVAVDISGRGFARMSMRKKLPMSQSPELNSVNENTVKRRSKLRNSTGRSKNKRRNTIAGTDGKEIKQAINEESTGGTKTNNDDDGISKSKSLVPTTNRCIRSISTDILQEHETELTKWNFDAFKAWGRSRLRSMRRQSSDVDKNMKASSSSGVDSNNDEKINDTGSKDSIVNKANAKNDLEESEDERKPSFSSISISDNSVATSSVAGLSTVMHKSFRQQSHHQKQQQLLHQRQQQQKHGNSILYDVRLRESAAQRREKRKGNSSSTREDPIHSSSGNWSASSESGRTSSIGSEIVPSNLPGRSSSSSSSSKLLSHNYGRRFKGRDTPTSSSVTSEASTLTPDIIQDIITYPGDDCETEGETCSIYSCDTEGYYTSFHMDSGLKTLREEELAAATAAINNSFNASPNGNVIANTATSLKSSTSAEINCQNQNQNAIVENEYELFGRGSTSTTTSSAGTVCTTLMAAAPPAPPERKSSLTVVAMVHGQNGGGNSPDSGHNTCSSPVESASASSPACCTARSCSELEYSESSDLEGYDRIERIRYKTAISTNRIPSMCVITPSGSDDEQGQSQPQQPLKKMLQLHDTNSATYELSNPSVIGDKSKGNACNDSGDYVTIADYRNHDRYKRENVGQVYANVESKNYLAKRQQEQSAKLKQLQDEAESAEYVSLSDLPKKSDCSLERKRRQGARVVLDYQGKVIYSSDSLKRRKESHTTFNPGPFIKESSPIIAAANRTEKASSEAKPRAFVNLAHQQHQVGTTSEKSGGTAAGSSSSSMDNKEEEDANWIRSGDEVDAGDKLQDEKVINKMKSKNLSINKRLYTDGLLSDNKSSSLGSISLYRQPDITRDLGSNQINLSQDKNKVFNNSVDKKHGNYQSQRCLMPLNLNTYDGSNQIITSSPLSQKFKENQPSERIKPDIFYNSALSPITTSNYYSTSSSPINSLVKNNKTMSNDELFTAIYKSKRKLNIKNDNEVTPGTTSDDSLIHISSTVPDNNKIGTRHSWSPESQSNNMKLISPSYINQEMSPKNTKTASAMTRLDFKRLLLQQSTKNRSSNLSAAEQLKLSNPSRGSGGRQVTYCYNSINNNTQPISNSIPTIKSLNTLSPINQRSNLLRGPPKVIYSSPYANKHESINPQRSTWKYQTPRSNILSCTIIEDVAAEETAVKQFLELSPSSSSNLSAPISSTTIMKDNKQIVKNNDKCNIFYSEDVNNLSDNNNLSLTSARFEAESLKKRNNQLKAQFLSSNPVDNNQIQESSRDDDTVIEKSSKPSIVINNSALKNASTSALETAL